MEQLWERNRVGRKETNRKLSTRTVKEGTRDQAGGNGENRKARAERSTVKATVRQKREERKGRSRELSSRKWNGSGRKEAEVRHRPRRRNLKGDHLWNSCGSEAGKDERKPTESQVSRTGRNERETGQDRRGKAEGTKGTEAHRGAAVRRRREEGRKEEQSS